MKKFIFLLAVISMLGLIGCDSQETVSQKTVQSTNVVPTETNTETIQNKQPEVQENKSVILKGAVFSSVTDFDEYAKKNDYSSATKNEDGTVTLNMTEKRYKKMLADTINTAEKSFQSSIEKNDSIKKIEHNDDLTEITILVDSSNYNYKEDTTYYNVYMNTTFYRMIDKPDAKCKIIIKDESTNETVYEITYPIEK